MIKLENSDYNDADPHSDQHKADGHGESEEGNKPITSPSKGSKWIFALKREELRKNQMLERQRQEREKRLQRLFARDTLNADDESEDEDIGALLDRGAAIKGFDETLGKIDSYLRAEMKLVNAW